MIDTARIRLDNNLLELAQRDTELKQVAATNGGEWAGPCPFCGGRDRFRVQPHDDSGGRWLCRKCTSGGWKDVIQYAMLRDKVDFVQACELLGGTRAWQPRMRQAPALPVRKSEVPAASWQSKAREIADMCAAALWAPQGARALAWLHERGLNDDTLRRWRLGCNPGRPGTVRWLQGLPVPCGIIIPCEVAGTIWSLKVRLSSGEPKYKHVKGSRPALYMAETLHDCNAAVLTEGEFDALLLWQEAGDLAGVATLGSAMARPDLGQWGKYLSHPTKLFVAYDQDETGRKGAEQVLQVLPHARRLNGPVVQAPDKDLGDFFRRGGRLRDWLAYYLHRDTCPVLEAHPPRLALGNGLSLYRDL